jgi:subtilisin family serine protease
VWLVDGTAAPRLIEQLEARGLLRYAELDGGREGSGHLSEGDPLLSKAWQIARVGADKVEPPQGGIPLAIVDTGLDITNPDFAGRPDTTLENTQSIGPFTSEEYHGTFVASTAAAAANGVGTVGIQPFAPLHIWDAGNLDDSVLIPELDQVLAGCPQIVNMSFGGEENTRALYEAIMRLVGAGCIVVSSVGNSFFEGSPAMYPGDSPHVLSVGSTDEQDRPAPFTSRAKAIDLAAPGVDIPIQSPTNPDGFALVDGTSFSAPIVTAAASWVWTRRPKLDSSQLFELLRRSARDVSTPGYDTRTGFGLVNLPAALAARTPARDPGEPNDDVDLVVAGGVFPTAKPLLAGRLVARVDAASDLDDVYRVRVPAHSTLTATLSSGRKLALSLWRSATRSVDGSHTNRLALRTNPKGGRAVLRYRNGGGAPTTLYVEVSIPTSQAGVDATYTLTARSR